MLFGVLIKLGVFCEECRNACIHLHAPAAAADAFWCSGECSARNAGSPQGRSPDYVSLRQMPLNCGLAKSFAVFTARRRMEYSYRDSYLYAEMACRKGINARAAARRPRGRGMRRAGRSMGRSHGGGHHHQLLPMLVVSLLLALSTGGSDSGSSRSGVAPQVLRRQASG